MLKIYDENDNNVKNIDSNGKSKGHKEEFEEFKARYYELFHQELLEAQQQRLEAQQKRQRAEKLEQMLRSLGIDPEQL